MITSRNAANDDSPIKAVPPAGGTAVLVVVCVLNTASDASAVNPFHGIVGPGFSNAFAALLLPLLIGLAVSVSVPKSPRARAESRSPEYRWRHDCQIPWCPEVEEAFAKDASSDIRQIPPIIPTTNEETLTCS